MAWDYLYSIYGDPRFVSDTVKQDIVKFRPLQHGEDARFCDLVHLVKRCYNTLKEVGVPYDMDNSHMLSIIEQKMCADDRKVWSRHLEREGKSASLKGLMEWMSVEMKSRQKGENNKYIVNLIAAKSRVAPLKQLTIPRSQPSRRQQRSDQSWR